VLAPPLVALLAPLRDLLGRMLPPGGRAEVIANLLDTGVDLLLRMPGALPPPTGICTRTRSPGRASGTKILPPSAKVAMPSPSAPSASIVSSIVDTSSAMNRLVAIA
jgi:hypothetical protein